MDDDLKIVISTVLKPDEAASAQAISAAVKNLEKKGSPGVKINVTPDVSLFGKQITQVVQSKSVDVKLNLDISSVAKLQHELNRLEVNPAIVEAMTAELDKMGVKIDSVKGRWGAVGTEQEHMLSLMIKGTDQWQRSVSYMQSYDAKTGEINTNLMNVTANLEQQRKAEERLNAQTDSRIAYLQRQASLLADIQASYTGATSVKPVTDTSHLDRLKSEYDLISKQINTLMAEEGALDQFQKAGIEAQIADLKRLVAEYQNVEYAVKSQTDSRIAYLQRQASLLADIQKSYTGATSTKPVTDTSHLEDLRSQYDLISKQIDELMAKEGALDQFQKAEIETQIADLKRLVKEYQNVEYAVKAQTDSRTAYLQKQASLLADIQKSYTGATSVKPVTDTTHLENLKSQYDLIIGQIDKLMTEEGALDQVQKAGIETQIADLKRLAKEYQNVEYVATKLRTKDIGAVKLDQSSALDKLKNQLESAGMLTKGFAQGIDGLRAKLANVTDKDSLVAFLNSFDKLNNSVAIFQERLRGVNAIYTQLIQVNSKITSTKAGMVGLNSDTDKEKLDALRSQLAMYEAQRDALNQQLTPYANILQYAKQREVYERANLANESQLQVANAALADQARQVDIAMQSVGTTVDSLQTKFTQLAHPSETLVANMRLLRDTMKEYSADRSPQEKVAIYQKLNELIRACNKEMTGLRAIQRGDILDAKFTSGLEKAKADLATVGRQWSALKHDPGLNQQFLNLQTNLRNVNNQMELTKWKAQFSAFKSEVKAAGKNMQSLGDILKNNAAKVMQWVSATTLLFRAYRLLRSAISTVVGLDTAMIDLQKVTKATAEEYRNFYLNANETAKALGTTTEGIISQTAAWSRLGYNMKEAAELAKNSAIFEAISPDMNIDQATDGLVSILKAFQDDIKVEDALDGIISKVNLVGNEFAVSNGNIVESLTRSSSAMAAANNTFEETVALATAAIEITRDAAGVGEHFAQCCSNAA